MKDDQSKWCYKMNTDFLKDWRIWAIAGGLVVIVAFLVLGGGGKVNTRVGDGDTGDTASDNAQVTKGDGNNVNAENFKIDKSTKTESVKEKK